MKKLLLSFFVIAVFCASLSAQKISKPTLAPSEPTPAQKVLIDEAVALHDAKKYDEAIKKYREVLAQNPDCVLALYGMALSYFNKPDPDKALETALTGTKYKARELPLFYGVIANVWDDKGKSEEAIKLYQDGIKMLKGEKDSERHLAELNYNLGISYARQKKYVETREVLKTAVELNFAHPSANYVLAEVFYGTKYKVPAILAAARLVSLELNTPRSKRAVKMFLEILKSAKKDENTGNINIFLDMNAPKDEGDFMMYDLILGTLTSVKEEKDKNKSAEEIFAEAMDSFIALLGADKKLPKTFVGKNYIPFMVELKKKGYSKVLAYLILQQDGNKAAEKWLADNNQLTAEFVGWAKNYKPTK